ncbi:uncharacterized protein LOC125677331 [Ostrea edulis]|uniref:uncharacterized protein LOC125677331 n=1 Tax=Ostrea edulis TaxID=37623 RepID=UPI0024AEC1A0|nr:uncharacterized protein LOC125677331 [Ostrea edulis]
MNRGLETISCINKLLGVLRTGDNQPDFTMVSRDSILDILNNAPELKRKLEKEQREGDIRFTFRDLESAIYEITRRPLAEWMTNNPKKKISGLFDFVHGVTDLLDVTSKADDVYGDYHERNDWRTITIETKYIGTTDFKMEEWDKKFLTKQGEYAIRAYFGGNSPQDTTE